MTEPQKPSQEEIDQVRAKAEEIVQRAKSDPAFAQQFRDDPTGTLQAEGIPNPAIGELLQMWGAKDAEVSGYYDPSLQWCYVTEVAAPSPVLEWCSWSTS